MEREERRALKGTEDERSAFLVRLEKERGSPAGVEEKVLECLKMPCAMPQKVAEGVKQRAFKSELMPLFL